MSKVIFTVGIALLCIKSVLTQSFEEQCLDRHNYYRAEHQAPDLQLDDTLQAQAQDWADHLASTGEFSHRPNNDYGENLFWQSGSASINGATAVDAWYSEIADYDWDNPGFQAGTGHFTQVVWKDSALLGCAVAQNGTQYYVVANYDPPGNWEGEFEDNVLPAQE